MLIQDLINNIKQTGKATLINLELFDVYKGEHIDEGYKSVAFSLVFNDKNKTLSSEEVDKIVNRITKRLIFEYEAKLRE